MALNPLNTDAVGILGLQIVHTGEFERGAAIVRRAMELNPNHAGWMHFAPLWEHFHKGEYEQALERANRVDVPGLFWPYLVDGVGLRSPRPARRSRGRGPGPAGARSRVCGARALERRDLALRERPHGAHPRRAAQGGARDSRGRRIDRLAEAARTVTARPIGRRRARTREPVRADEGFWVAVLPFKYGGADASLTALAEGLTEEIVTGLSRFSYLRVIARELGRRRAVRRQGARRALRDGRQPAAGGDEAAPRRATRRRDLRRSSLGRELSNAPSVPETVFELQDESGSADRLDGRRHARCLAAQHERSRAAEGCRSNEPIRSGAAQLRLQRALHPGGPRRSPDLPGSGPFSRPPATPSVGPCCR